MVNINLAYTAPINPEGASPILSVQQIWKGLERKVRYAQEFVPVIESCEVIEEEDNTVTRDVLFKPGSGQGKDGEKLREVCKLYAPTKVDFYRPNDKSLVSNVVSDDPSGGTNIYMTYCFTLIYPDIGENDTAEIDRVRSQQKGMSKMAVEKSIETIRHMVQAGKIN